MNAISSQGGPLILLERRLLRYWHGIFDPSARPRLPISLGEGSDFDRACAISGLVGLVPVQSDGCLVLTQGTLITHWLPCEDDCGGAFCQWNYCDDFDSIDEEMAKAYQTTRDSAVAQNALTIRIADPNQLLFDAAEPGEEIESEYLELALTPGIYRVSTVTYEPNSKKSVILHHLLPV